MELEKGLPRSILLNIPQVLMSVLRKKRGLDTTRLRSSGFLRAFKMIIHVVSLQG